MPQPTLQHAFEQALRHHQAGQLREAWELYNQVLARQPNHPNALHLLGVIALGSGQNELAADLIGRAVALLPDFAEAHNNLGNAQAAKGDFPQAIDSFRRAISLRPGLAETHNNLGNALTNIGNIEQAIRSFRLAMELDPRSPAPRFNLGNALRDSGQLEEAIAQYQQAIVLNPGYAEAYCNLGIVLQEQGKLAEAITAYRRAVAVSPAYALAACNLGIALKQAGHTEEATAALREAIRLKPDSVDAYLHLGNALEMLGQYDQAITAIGEAIRLQPEFAELHYNLGKFLSDAGRLGAAAAAYRQAVSLKPEYVEAHLNLANTLGDLSEFEQAMACIRQALQVNPSISQSHNNLGNALKEAGQLDEAVAAYHEAIALEPSYAEAHQNLALALLLRGDFKPGWDHYEWRWKCKDFPSPRRNFTQPMWDGRPIEGRTLLLHTEQGLGDAIQFIRYVPLVARRGAKIIVECQPQLQRLFRTIPVECQIVARGQPLPDFDFHCPLLTLPLVFQTALSSIPNAVPYVSPDPAVVDSWGRRLGPRGEELRIGLAWAGNPAFKADQTRSLNLENFAPLAAVRRAKFFSLQKGPAGQQAKNPPIGLDLLDLGPELSDMADTAGAMSQMDLIISTDTSVPHLAGALGRPVWVLLQFMPDFRWLLEREESPWYPTMRLFRQPRRGDWDSVMKSVCGALHKWLHQTNRSVQRSPGTDCLNVKTE